MADVQRRRAAARTRGDHGVALVEFALVLPVLLLLICGVIDYGVLINRDTLINNAAREGAREASLGGKTADIEATIDSSLGSLASNATTTVGCRNADNTLCTAGQFDTQGNSGDTAIITVAYTYTWATPAPQLFGMGATKVISKTAEMRIE